MNFHLCLSYLDSYLKQNGFNLVIKLEGYAKSNFIGKRQQHSTNFL